MADDDLPRTGDTYTCGKCGMSILVTDDCQADGDGPFFACCGESMDKSVEKD